jgi:hypothetical protein
MSSLDLGGIPLLFARGKIIRLHKQGSHPTLALNKERLLPPLAEAQGSPQAEAL